VTARVYGDLSLRQAGNLGFLVREDDLALVHECLVSHGFQKQDQNEEEHSAARPLENRSCYQRIQDRLTLDAYRIRSLRDSSFVVAYEELWKRAMTWKYEEKELLVLTPNDHLIALCLLGAREQWRMLGTLADIAHLLRRHSELDVGGILKRSRTLGCETVSALGLRLAGWLVEIDRSAILSSDEEAKRIEQEASEIWTRRLQENLVDGCVDVLPAAASDDSTGSAATVSHTVLATAKVEAREHWASRSDAWERWSDLTFLATTDLSEKLFDAAGVAAGHRVLDLACGPGDTSLLLSPRVGPSGIVASTDLVPDMVMATEQRARAVKLANLKCSVADMENLPFSDQVFDSIVCRLGIMYCPQVERALSEAHRVLKPGGRAAFLVCGPMENNHVLAVVHEVLWDLFDVRPDDSPAPFRFAAKNSLAPLMEEAGFTGVEEQELRFDTTRPKEFGFWQPSAERAIGWKLAALPPATRRELEHRMDAALQPYLNGDSYRLSSHSRIGAGTSTS
jgi:SAM-dependent methyltransferase